MDFGQNLAGWLEFKNVIPKGEKVSVEFGEIMQDDEFYRDNLRSARAQFTYISDGKDKWIRPHFTYFGFRYVKLNDFPEDINIDDFKVVALYSDMKETGYLKTDNPEVNRLFENVKWGQKSNFIDIPTDCPQRDERLGWTGDAAIFAKTASYNMDTYEFFKKFAYDIAVEQSQQMVACPCMFLMLIERWGQSSLERCRNDHSLDLLPTKSRSSNFKTKHWCNDVLGGLDS